MSTTGQALGYVVGAVAGYFTFGASYVLMGAALGGAIGAALDPPKGPNTSSTGPRLTDLSQQTSTYGANIPRLYGTIAVMGNVFWLENNQIKETVTKETTSQGGKGGGGGGESTTTTFTYSATFALGLCEGPIVGVRRIWVGSNLIYDAGSDDLATIHGSNAAASGFTVYTGSETQLPDDRMQATLGVENTPAYRGLAYIVFKDFQLADYGNSLLGAPVKVEVVASGTVTSLSKIYSNANTGFHFEDDLGGSGRAYPINFDNDVIKVGVVGQATQHIFDYSANLIMTENSNYLIGGGSGLFCDMLGGKGVYVSGAGAQVTGTDAVLYRANGFRLDKYLPVGMYICGVICDVNEQSAMVVLASDGPNSIAGYGRFAEIDSDGNIIREGTCSFVPNMYENGIGFSRTTANWTFAAGSYDRNNDNIYVTPGWATTYWIHKYQINNGVMDRVPTGLNYTYNRLYSYPSIFTKNGDIHIFAGPTYDMFSSGIIASTMPTVGGVVGSEIARSGLLNSSDINTSELTQSVRGYKITSVGSIRTAIQPLQSAFPFDAIQSGYKIKFKKRGSSAVATVNATDLDARVSGEKPGVSISSAREMDSVLPSKVSLKFLDVNREYDIGEQYAERIGAASVNVASLDQPIVMTASEAAGNAEMLLYLYWMERYDVQFRLPPTFRGLEPADVITLNTADSSYSLRLGDINYLPDGRLECAAKYNSSAIYTPSAVGEDGLSTGGLLIMRGPTRGLLLDIPTVLDSMDAPGYSAALSGYYPSWPGGVLSRTDDAGQTWATLQGFTAPGAIIGLASNVIGAGRLDLIDKASVLDVSVTSGALSSVTEAAMLNGYNHFAYGIDGRWEIIGAQNCTLQGDGTYKFSSLLRGRFGSEWARASHAAGDYVVYLDPLTLGFITTNINAIGVIRTFRAITSGQNASAATPFDFTYQGVNLECLAPVYLNGNRHPASNDWTLTWQRRTRVGGEWRDYVDATLGETSEAYEIEIMSGATVKRTLNASSPTVAYTSAQQVADFGSNQATLSVKIYQLSDKVGRGYPLTASITR